MSNPRVTLYTRLRCHLCDVAKDVIESVRSDRPFELEIIDVDTDPEALAKYTHEVPVILVNGRKAFKVRVDAKTFRERLDREEEPTS
jgi:glutaredoxin